MDDAFNTDVNYSYHENKMDATTDIVSTITGGVTATVVGAAASLWNSLPFTPEVETADLIGRVSNNALQVYNENTDLIDTASFVAGSFLPAGLALKGMKALRGGSKAVNWFTAAGKEADVAKVSRMFAEGAKDTRDYRNAVRGLYGKTAVNQAIDAVAMEVAVLGMLNDSPIIEDYMKDPVKNFTISVALGGVIGGGLGLAADHFAVRSLAGNMSEEAITSVRQFIDKVPPNATNAAAVQVQGQNIKNLDQFLENNIALGKTADNDLASSWATKLRSMYVSDVDDAFTTMVSPGLLSTLDITQKNQLKALVVDGIEMAGVQKIELASAKGLDKTKFMTAPKGMLGDTPELLKTTVDALGDTNTKAVKAYYFPDLKAFGDAADMAHYAGAVALGKTPEQMAKEMGKFWNQVGDFDTALSLNAKSAAVAQSEYIGAITRADKMSVQDIGKMKVAPSDNVSLEAWLAKAAKDQDVAAAGLRIASPEAYGAAIIAEKKIEHSYDFAKAGMMDEYDPRELFHGQISADAGDLLTDWIRGSLHDMRTAATEYTRGGFSASRRFQSPEAAKLESSFKEIYLSRASEVLRSKFRAAADEDGFIYLWRGTRTMKDRSAVRSYSTVNEKAGEFGEARLYKVQVDDIIAGFHDGGKTGIQPEILVLEGQRLPVAASLSKEGKAAMSSVLDDSSARASVAEVHAMVMKNKAAEIDMLMANGIPMESIAIKTNTPMALVERHVFFPEEDMAEVAKRFGVNTSIIDSTEAVASAMSPMKAPLQLTGNARKTSYTDGVVGRDANMMRTMNNDITANVFNSNTDPFVRELGDFLMLPTAAGGNRSMLDMLYNRLGKANNENAGNFFTQSADYAMRNMGDLGPIVSYVGKGIQSIGNKMIKAVNEPLAEAMAVISKSPTEILEFNVLREVNAGLKGWRTFKDGQLWQRALGADGKVVLNAAGEAELVAVTYQGRAYQVVSPSVIKTAEIIRDISPNLRNLANTSKKITGSPEVNDIGFWIPSLNPVNKQLSYVHDSLTDKTTLLWSNTPQEHAQLLKDFRASLVSRGIDKTTKVYEKGVDQKNWSRMNDRLDSIHMERADIGMQKGGSSSAAVVRMDDTVFREIVGGYEHYINSQVRQMADLAMHDITHELGVMSTLNRWGHDAQPLGMVKAATDRPRDAAASVKNLLLGDTNLGEFGTWKNINTHFETGLAMAAGAFNKTWDATVAPLKKGFFGGKKALSEDVLKKMDYETFAKKLADDGIVNPWQAFDDEAAKMYGLSALTDSPDTSRRIVFASNALAATLMLRVGELAQPLVNMMSLPILTGLAAANKMPANFMGAAKGTAKTNMVQIMYEGARAAHDPQFAALGKKWESLGYFTPMVSEANATLGAARSLNRGAIENIEKAIDSSFVNFMSKPADLSEGIVRRQTMYTGAVLAKRLYPELDDAGVTIFARDFMDKAVGNFHSSQRPVMFQGTLGVALGLFQTYSLTLAQSIYRQMELKNYKALGAAMLTQSSLFGAGSMPGFAAVSNMIGEHYSDNHVDLVTGTYRAVGDTAAQTVLYGLPSLAGIGTHTRGDSNFRIPGLTGDNVVAINVAQQAAQSISSVARSFGEGSNAGQAFLEALSLQSISRPLARGAELANGYSITRAGNTVQTPAEVWTAQGIMARVIGTRPATELKLREADQLNRFYGAVDKERRQKVMKGIKTALRNDNLQDSEIAALAEEYFRFGGTPTGWRSALNTAVATTETSGKEVFVEKLKPDSPLIYMLNGLDGS